MVMSFVLPNSKIKIMDMGRNTHYTHRGRFESLTAKKLDALE